MQNEYGSQGLQVVGVAMDDSGKDEIAKFAKDMGVNYPVLLGKEAVGMNTAACLHCPRASSSGATARSLTRSSG